MAAARGRVHEASVVCVHAGRHQVGLAMASVNSHEGLPACGWNNIEEVGDD